MRLTGVFFAAFLPIGPVGVVRPIAISLGFTAIGAVGLINVGGFGIIGLDVGRQRITGGGLRTIRFLVGKFVVVGLTTFLTVPGRVGRTGRTHPRTGPRHGRRPGTFVGGTAIFLIPESYLVFGRMTPHRIIGLGGLGGFGLVVFLGGVLPPHVMIGGRILIGGRTGVLFVFFFVGIFGGLGGTGVRIITGRTGGLIVGTGK